MRLRREIEQRNGARAGAYRPGMAQAATVFCLQVGKRLNSSLIYTFYTMAMMDEKTGVALPGDFQKAAIQRQDVTIPLDTDVLAYIQAEFGDWKGHINDLVRFFMETNQRREMEFQDCFDPSEMDRPPDHPGPP